VNSIDGEMFGYSAEELQSSHVGKLIPFLSLPNIDYNRFYSGVTAQQVMFPLSCTRIAPDQLDQYIQRIPELIIENSIFLKCECMPNVAGMITVTVDGLISHINTTFSEAIFGIPSESLIGTEISKLIPNYSDCVKTMRWTSYIQEEETSSQQSNLWCTSSSLKLDGMNVKPRTNPNRFVLQKSVEKSPHSVFCTPRACHLTAKHRDMSLLRILVQCRRWIPAPNQDPLYALWVSFHKEHYEYPSPAADPVTIPSSSETPNQSQTSLFIETDMANLSINTKQFVMTSPVLTQPEPLPKAAPIVPFPPSLSEDKDHVIEDFDIIDSLGEGAFSFIKLCTYRNDPNKVSASELDTFCHQVCGKESDFVMVSSTTERTASSTGSCYSTRSIPIFTSAYTQDATVFS
jgi:hypothetical protein